MKKGKKLTAEQMAKLVAEFNAKTVSVIHETGVNQNTTNVGYGFANLQCEFCGCIYRSDAPQTTGDAVAVALTSDGSPMVIVCECGVVYVCPANTMQLIPVYDFCNKAKI